MKTKKIYLLVLFILTIDLMGQIIITETNETFQDDVNAFFDANINKSYQLNFFQEKDGKSYETERIIIKWDKADTFQETIYSLNEAGKLHKWFDKKQINFHGEFSDIMTSNVKNGNEIKKINNKLYVKHYDNNKVIVEKILTLNEKGKILHQEHTRIDGEIRETTFADFIEKTLSDNKFFKSIVYFKIINGKKIIDFQNEITYTIQIDKKNRKHTIFIEAQGSRPDTPKVPPYKDTYYKYFDADGKLLKIEYPKLKQYMTVKYI